MDDNDHFAAAKSLQSCLTLCDPMDCMQPSRLLHPWDFSGKSTGVGCHHLLRMIILRSCIWSHVYPTLKNLLEMWRFFFSLFFPEEGKCLIITNETLPDSEKGLNHPLESKSRFFTHFPWIQILVVHHHSLMIIKR